MSKINRRQALAAAAGLAAAPLAPAVASGAQPEGTIASIQGGVINSRENREERLKKAIQAHVAYVESMRFVDMGLLALICVGFTGAEARNVRKDICKIKPNVVDHRRRFLELYFQKTDRIFQGAFLWHGIVVTFRTSQDGFSMLGLEDAWNDLVEAEETTNVGGIDTSFPVLHRVARGHSV